MKPRDPMGRVHPIAHGPTKASEHPDRTDAERAHPSGAAEPCELEVTEVDDAYDDVPCTD